MILSSDAKFSEEKNCWEIKIAGEIDISNARQFKSQLETLFEEKPRDIVIDLTDLSYIDSTGFGVIIGTYSSVKKHGLTVKLRNPKDNVRRLLTVSGLDKIFC
jgi:anti-sigma B factor antagonist